MPRVPRPPPHERDLEPNVILNAIHGSSTAFVQLFDHHQALVRYVAARAALACKYFGDIEDLVQEVWCRLLGNDRKLLTYFDPKRGPFRPFIGRLAFQQAMTTIHRHRRQLPDTALHDQDEDLEDRQMSRFIAELTQSDLYDKLLQRANAELDESDRLLLREVHLNQRTGRAVAEELGITENTLHKRNERLKKKLAKMVCELLGVNEPHEGLPLALAMMIVGATLCGLTVASFDDTTSPVDDPISGDVHDA